MKNDIKPYQAYLSEQMPCHKFHRYMAFPPKNKSKGNSIRKSQFQNNSFIFDTTTHCMYSHVNR